MKIFQILISLLMMFFAGFNLVRSMMNGTHVISVLFVLLSVTSIAMMYFSVRELKKEE